MSECLFFSCNKLIFRMRAEYSGTVVKYSGKCRHFVSFIPESVDTLSVIKMMWSDPKGGYDKSHLLPRSFSRRCVDYQENPGGVSWCNNPSFPLKGSVSEPEDEA